MDPITLNYFSVSKFQYVLVGTQRNFSLWIMPITILVALLITSTPTFSKLHKLIMHINYLLPKLIIFLLEKMFTRKIQLLQSVSWAMSITQQLLLTHQNEDQTWVHKIDKPQQKVHY